MKPRAQFITEAYRLSRSAPQAWREFLAAFRVYVAEQTEDSIKASVDTALVAHGRAQSLVTLRDDLADVEAIYNKINSGR